MADEAALLDRIRQYDQAALAQAYDDNYDRIYRYVYRFVGQVNAAEDLTANVFLRLLTAVRTGNSPRTNLVAWLYRVAHNLVVDSFRRTPADELELTDWLVGHELDLTHKLDQSLQMEKVRKAVADLTLAQQQVIVLRFLEELDSAEIAAILDKTEGAVDALQHRALVALRQALNPPQGPQPGSQSREDEQTKNDISQSAGFDRLASLIAALLAVREKPLCKWREMLHFVQHDMVERELPADCGWAVSYGGRNSLLSAVCLLLAACGEVVP